MAKDHYYSCRAEHELRMAQQASSDEARRAHYELAGYLLDACYNPEWRRPGDRRKIIPLRLGRANGATDTNG